MIISALSILDAQQIKSQKQVQRDLPLHEDYLKRRKVWWTKMTEP
jgi:hypothetical protein